MAIILQTLLFSWDTVESSPEMLRLTRVLDEPPDEPIIRTLVRQRKAKRNDYPIEAVWNSLVAGIVFGHDGVESLRRELARNAELRQVLRKQEDRETWQPLDPEHHDTIYYDGTGRVACKIDLFEASDEKAFAPMQFMGFEKDRETLKFRCPAAVYGIQCKNRDACRCKLAVRQGDYGRVVRIPLDRDRRVFMPVHRHSRTFRKAYKKRSSVERVNSRIDQVYGFERHFIRGHAKMHLRVSLTLIVMLAMAAAWIRAGQKENARSLLRAA